MSDLLSWTLRPGDTIKRTALHLQFGGSGQGGISPSARTPNIFLFTDPAVGIQHGYIADGWRDDGIFNYTGEGQRGDQVLKAGNGRLLHHKTLGKALRLFSGSRGVVVYVGEFALAEQDQYHLLSAPATGGGPSRNILVFHLRQMDKPNEGSDDARLRPAVFDVPVEEQYAETYFFDSDRQSITAQRREATLVAQFCRYMTARGYTVGRKRLLPDGETMPLFTDVHVNELNLLVEAKGTAERGPFRTAIGQLADYRRFLNRPRCAILVPLKPTDDLVALAMAEHIELYWPEGNGFGSATFSQTEPSLPASK